MKLVELNYQFQFTLNHAQGTVSFLISLDLHEVAARRNAALKDNVHLFDMTMVTLAMVLEG